MTDHSPSSAFPSLHWTEGEPSVLVDFSFSGGEQGAYQLLALDETLGEAELCKQMKGLVMGDLTPSPLSLLDLATAVGAQLPSQRLGAALLIACARSSRQQGDPYSHWDDLCGTLFSVEAHLGILERCLPVPSARTVVGKKKVPLFLLPGMLVWDVDESEDEGAAKGPAASMVGSILVDFTTNDCKILMAGDLRSGLSLPIPPIHDLFSSLFPDPSSSSTPATAAAPTRRVVAGLPGLSGITDEQLKQLARRGGVRKGPGGGAVALGGGGSLKKSRAMPSWDSVPALEDHFTYLREGARRASHHKKETKADIAELEAAIAAKEREIEQLRQALEDSKAREKKQVVDVAIQTDTFFPLVITRPSSPILLPSSPTDREKLDVPSLQPEQALRIERIEAGKLRERLTTVESDLAAEKALPKIHLPTAALSLVPTAVHLVNRLEPLAKASRELLAEAGETWRLKEENEQLRRQLQSVQGPAGPAHPPSALALSRLNLDRPSDRAAYVVKRLVGQLRETRAALRESTEENVELLLSLVSG
ncbi:hypothetical protein JCM10213v2_007871 [Rhodosporidiobolus nylandii]